MSNSLWPHESQHTRPPCPSPTPRVHSASRPSSQWCHPATSSSVVPFSSCPQSLPTSEFFLMSQLFAWGGQSTEVSALASFLPKKPQGWSPSGWTGWISLQSKGLSRVFSNTTVQKHLGYPQSKADTSPSSAPIKVSLMGVLLLSLHVEKMGAGDLNLVRQYNNICWSLPSSWHRASENLVISWVTTVCFVLGGAKCF